MHKQMFGIDSSSNSDRQYPMTATNFGWCQQLEPTVSFWGHQLDGDRITNYSKIGDGRRVTDNKVDGPKTTNFVLEYRHNTKVLK